MKTYSAKPTDVTRQWYIVDASEAPLGRLATVVATYLMGKHKPMYTPHIDCGDFVIVINASSLKVTGNKLTNKKYRRYSGYPGGLKEINLQDQLAKDATLVVKNAVKGMVPTNKLADERLARLRIFTDNEHAHTAQKPTTIHINGKKTEVKNG